MLLSIPGGVGLPHLGSEAMLSALIRAVLVVVVLVGLAAFFIGYRLAVPERDVDRDDVVGTSGRDPEPIDVDRARETGAELGERVAAGASEAEEALNAAALTAKIKSKMALDDTIAARYIDVDTQDGVVTLSGTVESDTQRQRALQLARETDGVSSVVDRLQLR
jgi:osmotically-inducible protein OsmY